VREKFATKFLKSGKKDQKSVEGKFKISPTERKRREVADPGVS